MVVAAPYVLTAVGVGIGLAAYVGLTRLMSSLLYGTSPLDPATFLAMPVVLGAAAALASYLLMMR